MAMSQTLVEFTFVNEISCYFSVVRRFNHPHCNDFVTNFSVVTIDAVSIYCSCLVLRPVHRFNVHCYINKWFPLGNLLNNRRKGLRQYRPAVLGHNTCSSGSSRVFWLA